MPRPWNGTSHTPRRVHSASPSPSVPVFREKVRDCGCRRAFLQPQPVAYADTKMAHPVLVHGVRGDLDEDAAGLLDSCCNGEEEAGVHAH
jgi:hypothetical protein